MRIFLTGATGFVGSAVAPELLKAGHQVLGLARSDESAAKLKAIGADVHRGDIDDTKSLRRGVQAADGIIHTAFNHDFSKFKESCEHDRQIIHAIGDVLVGTDKPFLVTSGVGILPPMNRVATERDMPVPGITPRIATEEAADAVAAKGVRVALIRLPPSVHDKNDHGFVPILIDIAREKGVSAYVEKGENRWPAVHRLDAAKLYQLAIEHNFKTGTRFHPVAEEGVLFREIAETIGKRLNVPVVSQSKEEAAEHFGSFAPFTHITIRASSRQTRDALSWKPEHHGLIADIDTEAYFPEMLLEKSRTN